MPLQILSLELLQLVVVAVLAIIIALVYAVVVLFRKYVSLVQSSIGAVSDITKIIEKQNLELFEMRQQLQLRNQIDNRTP